MLKEEKRKESIKGIKHSQWYPVKNYEGFYEISLNGDVRSVEREDFWGRSHGGLVLKQAIGTSGYLQVQLSKRGKVKPMRVHKLMAETFLGHIPCGSKLVINHINHNKLDNRIENLEEVTTRENASQGEHLKGTSRYVGVHWYSKGKKWKASIRYGGQKRVPRRV